MVFSRLLSQFHQSIDRKSYLGEFVDGRAVMFKNITSYLGKCVAAVCECVFVPGRVCRWRSRYVKKQNVLPG